MSHEIIRPGWATIDLDTTRGHVFVREDWRYDRWTLHQKKNFPVSPWTDPEKHAFHNAVDRMIWAFWSRKARFRVVAKSAGAAPAAAAFVRRFNSQPLTVTFDVRKVHGRANWSVTVEKFHPEFSPKPRAEVDPSTYTIKLTSFDITARTAFRDLSPEEKEQRPGETERDFRARLDKFATEERAFVASRYGTKRFRVAPHEFGHTIGAPDEYGEPKSEEYHDLGSLMNIGRQIRPRHLYLVGKALEKLVPGCAFIATTT